LNNAPPGLASGSARQSSLGQIYQIVDQAKELNDALLAQVVDKPVVEWITNEPEYSSVELMNCLFLGRCFAQDQLRSCGLECERG
jgi:hypothetical protein